MMPLPRQKQGLGGNSSIAYKRWEPLNENDNDDNGDSLENEPDDTGQVCIMLLKKVLINQKNAILIQIVPPLFRSTNRYNFTNLKKTTAEMEKIGEQITIMLRFQPFPI